MQLMLSLDHPNVVKAYYYITYRCECVCVCATWAGPLMSCSGRRLLVCLQAAAGAWAWAGSGQRS